LGDSANAPVKKQSLAEARLPAGCSSNRRKEGEIRVIAIGPAFTSLVAESFDQIRENA
jgi:hypothetical protein